MALSTLCGRLTFVGICLGVLTVAHPGEARIQDPQAEQDVAGAKDHPLVPRIGAQYYIWEYESQDFASQTFALGDGEEVTVEGKVQRVVYWLKDGAKRIGPLELLRNYKTAFAAKKGETLLEHADLHGARALFRLPLEGRRLWAGLEVGGGGESYTFIFAEEGGMTQQVELTAADMGTALASTGMVTVRGILFETGMADIRPESAATLAQIAALLSDHLALRLEIQGHTDNTGTAAANLTLSQSRAAAVKAWLMQRHHIDGARLTTAGLGQTKPVADNATEDGRAQNRRVELIKR